jgi:hypothetical protein
VRAEQRERTVELLLMLTSFAAYAQLVPDRSPDEVHDIVQRGFRDVLHLPET